MASWVRACLGGLPAHPTADSYRDRVRCHRLRLPVADAPRPADGCAEGCAEGGADDDQLPLCEYYGAFGPDDRWAAAPAGASWHPLPRVLDPGLPMPLVSRAAFRRLPAAGGGEGRPLRVVVVSDTHEFHGALRVPPCDLLLHCGDFLAVDRFTPRLFAARNVASFADWLRRQPARAVVVIGGNHDRCAERWGREATRTALAPALYLEHEAAEVLGVLIGGRPVSTGSSGNRAFQDPARWPAGWRDTAFRIRDESPGGEGAGDVGAAEGGGCCRPRRPAVERVPVETLLGAAGSARPLDILMTHGPAEYGAAPFIEAARPRLHVCGHEHESHGAWAAEVRAAGGAGAFAVPSFNGASIRGGPGKEWMLPPVVFDLLLPCKGV